MTDRLFVRSKYSSGRKAIFYSERSGMPYRYRDMVKEPGTGLLVHKSESDGKWNRVAMDKKPIIPADPQRLEYSRPGFDFRVDAPESFFE
jgi:hypothetical protein